MCVFTAIVMLIPAMAVGSRRAAATPRVARSMAAVRHERRGNLDRLSRRRTRKCHAKNALATRLAADRELRARAARFCPFARNSGAKTACRRESAASLTVGVRPAVWSPVMSGQNMRLR